MCFFVISGKEPAERDQIEAENTNGNILMVIIVNGDEACCTGKNETNEQKHEASALGFILCFLEF